MTSRSPQKSARIRYHKRPGLDVPESGAGASAIRKQKAQLWSNNTKLAVSLTLIALLAWLLNRFRGMVGVLVLAVLLAYLLYPISDWLRRHLRISWRLASIIVFLLTVFIVVGLLTWGGFALVNQVQALINFIQGILKGGAPTLIEGLPKFQIGTFAFPPENDAQLNTLVQDLLGLINPILSRATTLLTALVSQMATFLGWTFFTLLIAYFIMSESGGNPRRMVQINLPGFNEDFRVFSHYLSDIWNAFLRGQLIIILITIIVYGIILSVLGIRFAIGLAILAGLARFVPYVGPAIAWTTYGLVAFFIGSSYIHLPPLVLVLLVVGIAWITDLILDNLVAVNVMGDALQIHPAMVTISALIGANLIGFIGVILAAPVVASIKLLLDYVLNKLSDRDPWEGIRIGRSVRMNRAMLQFMGQIENFLKILYGRVKTGISQGWKKRSTDERSE